MTPLIALPRPRPTARPRDLCCTLEPAGGAGGCTDVREDVAVEFADNVEADEEKRLSIIHIL